MTDVDKARIAELESDHVALVEQVVLAQKQRDAANARIAELQATRNGAWAARDRAEAEAASLRAQLQVTLDDLNRKIDLLAEARAELSNTASLDQFRAVQLEAASLRAEVERLRRCSGIDQERIAVALAEVEQTKLQQPPLFAGEPEHCSLCGEPGHVHDDHGDEYPCPCGCIVPLVDIFAWLRTRGKTIVLTNARATPNRVADFYGEDDEVHDGTAPRWRRGVERDER
jgi:multidrug efflux pump subunit AcrA (membrane-fusion protein)